MNYINKKNGLILVGAMVLGSVAYFYLSIRTWSKKDLKSQVAAPIEVPTVMDSRRLEKTLTATPHPNGSPESLSEVQKQFKMTATQVLQDLPTVEELRKLSDEEVHQTPEKIIQAGVDLGKIAEMLKAHPQLSPEGVQFYSHCSSRPEYPSSIRALCFLHLKEMDPKQAAESQVSQEIRDLADHI